MADKTYPNLGGTTKSQFRITPASFAGPPTVTPHQVGELHLDSQLVRWLCVASGTPGTWVELRDGSFNAEFGRNATSAGNLWLRRADRIPSNQSPLRVPYNCKLLNISATTTQNETCTFEVYKNADVRGGGNPNVANVIATLAFSAQNGGEADFTSSPVQLNAGDEIGVYLRGNGISRPCVMLFLSRR